MQRNCLFMIAARGRLQNDSMQALYIVSEYLCLPVRRSSSYQITIMHRGKRMQNSHSSLNVK